MLNIKNDFVDNRITLLGAGPMSPRVVEVVANLTRKFNKNIALIPSRRQIDAKELGGGYVNNWNTEEFAKLVKTRYSSSKILLSRDHSGPWQGTNGINSKIQDISSAMDEAKLSLSIDIKSGFDIVHIDPSLAISKEFSEEDVEAMAIELISHCYKLWPKDKPFIYEVGTDEQDSSPEQISSVESKLNSICNKLELLKLPLPTFYVVQTGTKVLETKNVGSFDIAVPVEGRLPSMVFLPKLIKLLTNKGIYLKEHNADYLSNNALEWHRRYGIHATNVAPEFGVAETTAMIQFARMNSFDNFLEKLVNTVNSNTKWQKWVIPGNVLDETQKTIIAGHYHYKDVEVEYEIHKIMNDQPSKYAEWENYINSNLEQAISRYCIAFGYGAA